MQRASANVALVRIGIIVCALLAPSVLLAGCTDLDAVRRFAKTSAATADYNRVVSDYALAPKRLKNYEPLAKSEQLDELGKVRAEQQAKFEAVQNILVAYMSALGDLAADELPSIDKEVDAFGAALEKAKFVGDGDAAISKPTATAAASIAKVLGRIVLDHWRQAQLAKIIRETDDSIQVVVVGLREVILQDFDRALDIEAEAVTKYFGGPIAAAEHQKQQDRDMVLPLARILMRDRIEEVEIRRAKLKPYAEVLNKIGNGHADLRENVGKLDDAALTARLKQYAKDLSTLYKAIVG